MCVTHRPNPARHTKGCGPPAFGSWQAGLEQGGPWFPRGAEICGKLIWQPARLLTPEIPIRLSGSIRSRAAVHMFVEQARTKRREQTVPAFRRSRLWAIAGWARLSVSAVIIVPEGRCHQAAGRSCTNRYLPPVILMRTQCQAPLCASSAVP